MHWNCCVPIAATSQGSVASQKLLPLGSLWELWWLFLPAWGAEAAVEMGWCFPGSWFGTWFALKECISLVAKMLLLLFSYGAPQAAVLPLWHLPWCPGKGGRKWGGVLVYLDLCMYIKYIDLKYVWYILTYLYTSYTIYAMCTIYNH